MQGKIQGGVCFPVGIVEEEADETVFWLELIVEGGLLPEKRIKDLMREAREVVAIVAASRKSASCKV